MIGPSWGAVVAGPVGCRYVVLASPTPLDEVDGEQVGGCDPEDAGDTFEVVQVERGFSLQAAPDVGLADSELSPQVCRTHASAREQHSDLFGDPFAERRRLNRCGCHGAILTR